MAALGLSPLVSAMPLFSSSAPSTAPPSEIDPILDALLAITALRFEERLALAGDGGPMDAVRATVNLLSEELAAVLAERDAAARTLAERNGVLESVLERMADVVVVLNTQGEVTLVNDAGRRLFAELRLEGDLAEMFAARPVLGTEGSPLRGDESPAARSLRGETVDDALVVVPRPEPEEPLAFSVNARPLLDPDGTAIGCVTVTRDVSRAQRAARALALATEAADQATRAKTAFLANMSHEIRTPMTAVLGFLELMEDDRPGAPERHAHLAVVRRSAEHLLTLLDDIIDLSRVEAGALRLEKVSCHPGRIVLDVVALLRSRADARGVDLVVECRTPIPRAIESDPTRLRQVVTNLVSNAIKFTEHGSVRVALSVCDGQLAIEVVDTGPGMDADELERAFEPFEQLDASTTRRHGGFGLGLAVARRLAGLLGGEIRAQSRPGAGSTFSLVLPLAADAGAMLDDLDDLDQLAHDEPPSARVAPSLPAETRVLVAEDGPENQLLFRSILERAGARVTTASDGRSAVDQALAAETCGAPFSVVLMDMHMPVMDGEAATRTLRAHGYTGPILALTADAMMGDQDCFLAAGCDEYLAKPVPRDALIAAVARHAGGGAAAMSERTPLISTLADDAETGRLVASFVAAMGARAALLSAAAAGGDWPEVKKVAHQLRGSGTGYGFPLITEQSAEVELAVTGGDLGAARASLSRLLGTLQRVRADHAEPDAAPGMQGTVLVIDDDPLVHDLIEARLRTERISLRRAFNSDEGLSMARELAPDVIVLDVGIGPQNGFELCALLKADPVTSALPVVFLTAAADPDAKLLAYNAGAMDYLVKPFDAADLRLRLRAALRSKRYQDLLAERARIDGLTGLGNRASFDERVATEVEGVRRYGRELAIVMLDIDHFKQVNDRHGHPVGDDVLRAVSSLLMRQLRRTDAAFRYGGEELAIVASGLQGASARALADKLRIAISALEVRSNGDAVRVTASFGVAPSRGLPLSRLTPAALIERADAALYRAKREGRNRVVLAD